MSQIAIIPVNTVDSSFLSRLASCLEERFLFTCIVERTVRVPRTALNTVRNQLFLSTLLARVSASTLRVEGYRLAVTDFDLYKTSHQFVFGDANEEHRIACISLHRLRPEFYGEPPDENTLFQRALKEAVHEVGHVLGLKHCFSPRCAMYSSTSIYDADAKLAHFCETCERKMRRTASS